MMKKSYDKYYISLKDQFKVDTTRRKESLEILDIFQEHLEGVDYNIPFFSPDDGNLEITSEITPRYLYRSEQLLKDLLGKCDHYKISKELIIPGLETAEDKNPTVKYRLEPSGALNFLNHTIIPSPNVECRSKIDETIIMKWLRQDNGYVIKIALSPSMSQVTYNYQGIFDIKSSLMNDEIRMQIKAGYLGVEIEWERHLLLKLLLAFNVYSDLGDYIREIWLSGR